MDTSEGYYDLTPKEVLNNPERYVVEFSIIKDADLRYPLEVMFYKERWLLLDGLHRLAKAYLTGKHIVDVRKIPKGVIPLISND